MRARRLLHTFAVVRDVEFEPRGTACVENAAATSRGFLVLSNKD